MSFYKKYELDRLIADGPAKTFRALESATGRTVFLHMFNPGGLPLLELLRRKLTGPDGQPVQPLLELGEFAGSPYAVTDVVEPFPGIESWLASLGAAQAIPPPSVAPLSQPSPTSAGPPLGEFTRIFGDQSAPPLPPRGESVPPPAGGEFTRVFGQVPAPSAPAPPASPAPQSGDFTRVFGNVAASPAAPLPGAPSPLKQPSPPPVIRRPPPKETHAWPPPAPSPKPPLVDDFDRLTGKAVSPPMPSLPDRPRPVVTPQEPGEYTQMFGSGMHGESIDIESEQARAARAHLPESKPFQQAGDFTRVFGPRPGSNAPPLPEPSANASASELFDTPEALAQYSARVLNKTPDLAKNLPLADDYARMTGPTPQPLQEVQPAPPAASPRAARDKTIVILAVTIAVLLLATVVLLAFLLLRKR